MSCDRARTSASNRITLINILFYPSGALCFHLYIFIFSNVLFHFFESITNRWTKVVVQHFWDTSYVLGRGIRNSIEIRVAFENRIRNRVASLAWREEGGVLLKASRLWEDSRIATYALSLRTRGSFCVPWSPPSLCTGYGNYGRKFGEFAERGKWGAGGGSKVPWLIALWGFVGQPFIMANLVFGHLSTGIQRLLIYTFLFIIPEFAPDFIYQNLYRI